MAFSEEERKNHLNRKMSPVPLRRTSDAPESNSDKSTGGHTQFPNQMLEKIMFEEFTSSELKLILWVFRNTYGRYPHRFVRYNPEKASDKTSFSRRQIDRAFSNLKQRNIFNFRDERKNCKYIQVNLSLKEWLQPQ